MPAIIRAVEPGDTEGIERVAELFRAYADWLGFDLCFQGFQEELAGLPGKYAPPLGRLLLAEDDGQAVACGALRPFDADRGELKRFFVRGSHRGQGIGAEICGLLIADAKNIGYHSVVLDTLQRMQPAIAMYRKFGFVERGAYYHNPIDEVVYFELQLTPP